MTTFSKSDTARWSVAEAAEALSAMANERRLQVLSYLATREATVTEIGEVVALSQSALSQHLSVLRRAGLVKTRREAQAIHYSIKSNVVIEVLGVFGINDGEQPSTDDQNETRLRRSLSGRDLIKSP